MTLLHKVVVLGSPGTGKTTVGLSYPGVEHHVFGSSEETTAANFVGRTDILPPVKFDWFDMLALDEQEKFTNPSISELEVALLTKKARAKNVARYRRYLYRLKQRAFGTLVTTTRPATESDCGFAEGHGENPLAVGDPIESTQWVPREGCPIKTLFLDNFSPFAQEFEDYVEIVWGKEFLTKEGNFDTIAYYKRFASELTDFLRLFMSLPCHTVLSCHIAMLASEELAANTTFLTVAKMGGVRKEWQPMLTGKVRNILAGIPDWCFFLKVEETPGQPTKYLAKLEADETNVGVAKPRIQPFRDPRRIEFPKNHFYEVFQAALTSYMKDGKPVENPHGK